MPGKTTAAASSGMHAGREAGSEGPPVRSSRDFESDLVEPFHISPPPAVRRRLARAKSIAFVTAGLAVVAALVYHVGTGQVVALLQTLGWRAPLILLPYGLLTIVDVQALARVMAPRARQAVSFWQLYWIRVAGEAVNNLTPTAGLAGEPVKAYLLRTHGVRAADGVAAVLIAKAALVSSQILFTLVGVVLVLDWLDILHDHAAVIAGGVVVGSGVVLLLVMGQRRGLVEASVRALRTIGIRSAFVERLEQLAAEVDRALIRFYRDDPRGFLVASSYHFLAWTMGMAEVMFFFHLMGVSCGWREALIVESLTQASTMSEAVVPGALGVQELSGAVVCRLLGIGEASGLALMLLKRVRQLAFSLFGVASIPYLARRGTTHE